MAFVNRVTKLQTLDWLRHNGISKTLADAWKDQIRASRKASRMKRFVSAGLK
jgi:hypothetical protein